MKCRVAGEPNNIISPADMADGDIGVIVGHFDAIGGVVQKHDKALIMLGGRCGQSWGAGARVTRLCIRLLTPPFSLEFTED